MPATTGGDVEHAAARRQQVQVVQQPCRGRLGRPTLAGRLIGFVHLLARAYTFGEGEDVAVGILDGELPQSVKLRLQSHDLFRAWCDHCVESVHIGDDEEERCGAAGRQAAGAGIIRLDGLGVVEENRDAVALEPDEHERRFIGNRFLYAEAQEIAAKNYYRPTDAAVAKKYEKQFAKATLFRLDEYFGNWQKAQKTHFADGGTFDQIYKPGEKVSAR